MDLVRFGRVIRALRRRRGWRQVDLAIAAGVSQDVVSLIERGHGDRLAFRTLMRVTGALDAGAGIDLRWRGGELERLLDEAHAALVAAVAGTLDSDGWDLRIEVTYAVYGQNGSIDVLAWHQESRSLLVLEIKTEITSGESTIRRLDEKVRLAADIARERFGWTARTVSRLLVVEDTTTARRRVTVGGALFRAAFPSRAVEVRRWLRAPAVSLSGLMFLPPTNRRRHMSSRGGRHRVRSPSVVVRSGGSRVRRGPEVGDAAPMTVSILTNRTYDAPGS